MKYRIALYFAVSLNVCLFPSFLKAQQSIQGPLSIHTTLNQVNADAGQALSIHDNNISGDTRFLTIGRLSNKPFIRPLASDRIMFMNQDGSLANAEIADDGIIYPRQGIIASYMVEKTGYWDAATSANVQISGGTLGAGGPQTKTFVSGWTANAIGQSITFDIGEQISVRYIIFGTFWATDPRFIPRDYTVLYSNDNSSFTTLETVVNNTNLNPLHFTQDISARYWRITVNGFQPGQTSASVTGLKILSNVGGASNSNYWGNRYMSPDISFTAGKVSIGTPTAPEGYLLAVNGAILSTKVKVLTFANWPDYVFESGYQLRDLDKVEAYIQYNKHLPDMPSAEDVRNNGIDLAANQAALLQKIEELTLYVIELKKENERQNKEIAVLKEYLQKN